MTTEPPRPSGLREAWDAAVLALEAGDALAAEIAEYLDPTNQFTESRLHAVREALRNYAHLSDAVPDDAATAQPTPELRAALIADVRALGTLTPEEWDERRGGDPIARTVNAVEDIIEARFAVVDGVREAHAGGLQAPSADPATGSQPRMWNPERDGDDWSEGSRQPANEIDVCDHRDAYGSTVILGENPAMAPVCIVCDKRFPHWPLEAVASQDDTP